MANWLRITIGIISVFLILFIAGGVIFYLVLKSSVPDYKGETGSNKINTDIEIYRDSMAVPYIIAQNDEDAAFALGYLHAQERLFQMDIARRAGEGRLSEILGAKALPFDKMLLTAGIKKIAGEIEQKMNPSTLKLLQAYSNGVNKYMEDGKGHYPAEFDVLGYDPYEWTPLHSIIIIRMMAWQLNIAWWADFSYMQLMQKLGTEKVMEILPDYPENAPYILSPGLKNLPEVNTAFMETDRQLREFLGAGGTHIGSNNWVVNGNKSVSGKPIIANDPHLAYSAPGRWYAAVIKAGSNTAAGVTLPGVPGVVIGKNDNISWTMTNIMSDDCDFYVEKLDSAKTKYMLNGSWHNLSTYTETIKVKDSTDVTLVIKSTHRGPIISDIHPYDYIYKHKNVEHAVVSMRWQGADFSDELYAFNLINKAKNFGEFKNAVSYFSVPGQNFVYADKQGNIGYVFGTRLPRRESNSPHFIFDGTTDANDWKGYIPQSELPMLYNPPANFIASANNKTAKDLSYYISNLWEPSSRIDRITELLTSKEKHSVEDYKKYQMDIISPYAREITGYILNAFKDVKVKDKNLNLTLELFEKWDYDFSQYSQTPAIYAVFFKHLLENIYKDEMGHDLFNEFVFMGNVPYRSVQQVLANPNNSWIDNVKTPGKETRDEIIRKSLSGALSELERKFGTDVKEWQWGSLHKMVFKHAFSGQADILDKFVNIGPFPIGGDGTTIFNTEYPFNEGIKGIPMLDHNEFDNDLGPSMRFIFDFATPDEFYLILTTGESGNIMSNHYDDMTGMWLNGRYMVIRTDEASMRGGGNKLFIIRKE